jgi:glutamate synthase (NADPH/NADH) large chain
LWQSRREGLLQRPEGSDKSDQSGEGKEHPAIDATANGEAYDPVTKEDHDLVYSYRKGVAKGMLKVMAKMGISTLQSYKGAQIFEAVGLKDDVINRCFSGTASRIQGVDFKVLAEEALRRHSLGYPEQPVDRLPVLPNPGEFHWRADGERHMWDPASIADLQVAARNNSVDAYRKFADHANRDAQTRCALRGLLQLKSDVNGGPIPIEEVISAKDIVKRFCTGAMSFGSISAEAHETLAIAMNRLGGKSNTGEGGEDPERFKPLPNGDSKRSLLPSALLVPSASEVCDRLLDPVESCCCCAFFASPSALLGSADDSLSLISPLRCMCSWMRSKASPSSSPSEETLDGSALSGAALSPVPCLPFCPAELWRSPPAVFC